MQSASQLDLFFETYERRYNQAGKPVFHTDHDKLIITFIPNFFDFTIQNSQNLNAVYKPLQCFYLAHKVRLQTTYNCTSRFPKTKINK
jgi:hypothetical protein